MRENIAMGSVADMLLGYINTAQVHDSNYEIALTMVRNYRKLRTMNIREASELCYVSQASLSRFCRFMGFESFKAFRAAMELDFSIRNDYSRTFFDLLKADDDKASQYYLKELCTGLQEVFSSENRKKIAKAADLLHDSVEIAWFSHHFLWDTGRLFQSKMIMTGRYIQEYLTFQNQLECAVSLTEKDTAVIASVNGSYFTLYDPIVRAIEKSGCHLIVMTQNTGSSRMNRADYVLSCGSSNRDDIGKYMATALSEYLLVKYAEKYGKEYE